MKAAIAAVCTLFVCFSAAASTIEGAWTASPNGKAGTVQLNLTTRGTNNFGDEVLLSDLGLSADAVKARESTPVRFQLRREAGAISFEGTFRDGFGGGQFTFQSNPAFVAAVEKLGLTIEVRENRTLEDELLLHALVDVTVDYIRAIRAVYPEATMREIRRARAVGVTPQSQRELRAVLRVDGLREATRLTAVGVTPDYVRRMRDAGVEVVEARDATKLRAIGVTPEFVARLAAAGYANLAARDLARLAAAGVDGDFIEKMKREKSASRNRK